MIYIYTLTFITVMDSGVWLMEQTPGKFFKTRDACEQELIQMYKGEYSDWGYELDKNKDGNLVLVTDLMSNTSIHCHRIEASANVDDWIWYNE